MAVVNNYFLVAGRNYLSVSYYNNPETEGFPVGTAWAKDRIGDDARKRAYVDRIRSEGEQMLPQIKNGLAHRLSAAVAPPPPAAATGPVKMENDLISAPLGSRVANPLALGAARVPLPDGEWTLLARTKTTNSAGTPLGTVRVARIVNRRVTGVVTVFTPLALRDKGYDASALCARKDLNFVNVRAMVKDGDQDCYYITYIGMSASAKTEPDSDVDQFYKFVEREKITVPSFMPTVAYRLATPHAFVNATYYFDADSDGVPPEPARSNASMWNPSRIAGDYPRAAYIEKLKVWAESWRPRVIAGFKP